MDLSNCKTTKYDISLKIRKYPIIELIPERQNLSFLISQHYSFFAY